MITATQRRPHTSAPLDGSRTITLRDAQSHPEVDNAAGGGAGPSSGEPNTTVGVLKLRGAQRRTRQRVAWGADVVDNEGCGKKKSKICCIYHKPRRFDESSSESDSPSDSDSGGRWHYGDDQARPTRRYRHAPHGHGCGRNTVRREGQGGTVHELHQPDSDSDSDSGVNAYERRPKRKN